MNKPQQNCHKPILFGLSEVAMLFGGGGQK